MTPDQIRLVQDSFALVRPIREQAAALFYGRLFALDPSTRPLFARADLRAQGEKLMAALGFVVGALRRPEAVVATAAGLARRHIAYGVREAHYAAVGDALLWTLGQGLGAAFTPELRDAWAAAYDLLSRAMIEATRDVPAPTGPPGDAEARAPHAGSSAMLA
jgi:hemoglobin-like flavoprotein